MTQLVEGNKIAERILKELADQIAALKKSGPLPRLVVILVGNNPSSISYVKQKQRKAKQIGLEVEVRRFPEDTTERELIEAIKIYNDSESVGGILVQLPLPAQLNQGKILNTVREDLDVDCLNENNKRKIAEGANTVFSPPAAAAILEVLYRYKVDLRDKDILIVGSGNLVGKPLAALLLNDGINFKIANRHTENLKGLLEKADVIVSATGVPGLIRAEDIKLGVVVIDAGTAISETKNIRGDVDAKDLVGKAKLIAPVPGGVGPVTVAMLLQNTVRNIRLLTKS